MEVPRNLQMSARRCRGTCPELARAPWRCPGICRCPDVGEEEPVANSRGLLGGAQESVDVRTSVKRNMSRAREGSLEVPGICRCLESQGVLVMARPNLATSPRLRLRISRLATVATSNFPARDAAGPRRDFRMSPAARKSKYCACRRKKEGRLINLQFGAK